MRFFSDTYKKIHAQQRQKDRQLRALTVNVYALDKESQTGRINAYHVSLSHCECMDFHKRKKPCKHIYRLAMELGLFPVPFGRALPKFQNAEQTESLQPSISKKDAPISSCVAAVTQSETMIQKLKTSKWLWIILFALCLMLYAALFGAKSSRAKHSLAKSPSVHSYHYDIKPHSQVSQPRIYNDAAQKPAGKTTPVAYDSKHPKQKSAQTAYIGNRKSHIFHYPGCRAVRKMNSSNMVDFETRETATTAGYRPCRICYP